MISLGLVTQLLLSDYDFTSMLKEIYAILHKKVKITKIQNSGVHCYKICTMCVNCGAAGFSQASGLRNMLLLFLNRF